MEKINIAKLLKDCKKDMELDCIICNGVKFIELDRNPNFPIVVRANNGYEFSLTKYGQVHNIDDAKCVIFPKGKTTWEGFQRPFEEGDVVVAEDDESFQLFLLKHLTHSEDDNSYDGYCYFGWDFQCNELFEKGNWRFNRLATEEEKAKLFQAIKDNGYKWNSETKTLEKLPKFKVGDKVLWNYDTKIIRTISKVQLTKSRGYVYWIDCEGCSSGWWNENELTPIPSKFDINTFKPFESRVLVRSDKSMIWKPAIYGIYKDSLYWTVGGFAWIQCVPYKDNENLLGTTNDCDEYYKNWEL